MSAWSTVLSDHGEKILAGMVALPYIAYRVYQTLRSDVKGESLDSRINAFSEKLQAQLDKVNQRADQLQIANTTLAVENATLKARIASSEDANLRLREMLTKALDRKHKLEEELKNAKQNKISLP